MERATLDQSFDLLKRVKDAGLSCEQLQQVFNSGVLADIFDAVKLGKSINREEVRKAHGLEPLLPSYPIVIDYSRTLAEMIAAGKYDWVNDDITAERFPVQGESGEREVVLFHFDRFITSDEAIKEMDKAGCEPEDPPALLAFGKQHPDLQRQFPIIALGSAWQFHRRGVRYVLYLWGHDRKRRLDLRRFEYEWNPRCRFAGRRKSGA